MIEIQEFLQDLLTIDCNIQSNLQNLLVVTSRESLEAKSAEIKHGLKDFKEKLNEMKDMYDSFGGNGSNHGLFSRLNMAANNFSSGSGDNSHHSTSPLSTSRDMFRSELQNQKEHLANVETRFRNAYLAAQVKLDQIERERLFAATDAGDGALLGGMEQTSAKKRHLNNQMLLKQSSDTTNKLKEINRTLKWTVNQTSEVIPVLDSSSRGLKNVQQDFGTMHGVINDGRRLLVRLSRREFTDKLLIVLCLLFFFSVVFYIVWKRLL